MRRAELTRGRRMQGETAGKKLASSGLPSQNIHRAGAAPRKAPRFGLPEGAFSARERRLKRFERTLSPCESHTPMSDTKIIQMLRRRHSSGRNKNDLSFPTVPREKFQFM